MEVDAALLKRITVSVILLLAAMSVYLLNQSIGHHIITEAYYERSIAWLNNIMEGRNSYTLAYYLQLADLLAIKLVAGIASLSLLPILFPSLLHHIRNRRSLDSQWVVVPFSLSYTAGAGIIVFIMAALPLCVVSFPPLIDYPFHIARIFILENWSQSDALQNWYHIRSFNLPNVGMDILVTLMAKTMPVDIAGRVFIAFIFGITLGGSVLLNRCLFGNFYLWPLFSSLFLFNWIFLLGFLNYLLGVGILLWALGGWILVSKKGPARRLVYGTIAATTLYFCHLSALGLYAIIVAGYELQRSVPKIREKHLSGVHNLIIGAATFIAPIGLFLFSSTAGGLQNNIIYRKPLVSSKVIAILHTLMSGIQLADVSLVVIVCLMLLLATLWGKLRFPKQIQFPLFLLFMTYILLPSQLLGIFFVDTRIPIALFFLVISFSRLEFKNRRWHHTMFAVFAIFLMFRCAVFTYSWSKYDATINNIVESYKKLPPNALLLVASPAHFPDFYKNTIQQPPIRHLASLATIQQMAFVPAIWAHPSEQPIVVSDTYNAIKQFQGHDPLLIQNSVTLEVVIVRIQQLLKHGAIPEMPVYLLVLDPQKTYISRPGMFDVIQSGKRFYLLSIKT